MRVLVCVGVRVLVCVVFARVGVRGFCPCWCACVVRVLVCVGVRVLVCVGCARVGVRSFCASWCA